MRRLSRRTNVDRGVAVLAYAYRTRTDRLPRQKEPLISNGPALRSGDAGTHHGTH